METFHHHWTLPIHLPWLLQRQVTRLDLEELSLASFLMWSKQHPHRLKAEEVAEVFLLPLVPSECCLPLGAENPAIRVISA